MRRKNENIIVLLMILALIAFVVGSAVGISVSINEHESQVNNDSDNQTFENVTVEMTSNITKSNNSYYDGKDNTNSSNKTFNITN